MYAHCRRVLVHKAPFSTAIPGARKPQRGGALVPRTFLGVPLRTPAGALLGALCVLDEAARTWSANDERALEELAVVLASELEARDQARRLVGEKQMHTAVRALAEASFDAIADVFFILGPANRLLRWNERMGIATGYSDDELASMPPEAFFVEEDRAAIREAVARVFREGKAISAVATTLLTRDGRRIPYELTGAPIFGGDGAVLGLCGTARDVTERKRAEEALRVSEARHRGLLEATPDLFFRLSREGRYLDLKASDPSLLVAEGDRLLGRTIPEILPEAEAARWCEAIGVALDTGQLQQIEYDLAMQDGHLRHFEARLVPVGAAEVQAIVRDVTERRHTQEALRQSERFLRSTLDALSAHIAVLDVDGVIVAVNEAWSAFGRANGAAPEAVGVGADYLGACEAAGEAGAGVAAALRDVLAGRRPSFTLEYPCHGPEEQRWFVLHANRFTGDGPPRVVVAHESVTERRRAAAALRTSEVLFRSFVESTAQVVWRAAPDGIFEELNGAWAAFTGQTAEEIERHWIDAVHPEDRTRILAEWADHLAALTPYQTEYRVRRHDGAYHRFLARAVPVFDEGAFVGWVGTCTDVEVQRRAEEALQASEERLRLALEAARMGTWDYDFQTGDLLFSSQSLALLGLPDGAIPGQKEALFDLLVEEDRERARVQTEAAVRDAQAGGPGALVLEFRLRSPGGEARWFRSTGRAYRGDDGAVTRMTGTVLDVTDEKTYEAALIAAKEAAEAAARLKGTLLANMSHEIRTPLTGIIGFADVLAEEATDGEPGGKEEFARIIGQSGRRLLETLNSVLDLAQLEAGRRQPTLSEADLRAVVAEAAELFRPRAEAQGLAFEVALPHEPVPLRTDAAALARVVTNLASNAVKFTRAGTVSVALTASPDAAEIRVADTGVGIAEAFLPVLFDDFRQESDGDGRHFEGSGLGLAITKRLVEMLGGEIGVESAKGVGSTFTVRLPRAAAAAEDGPLTAPPAPSPMAA